MSKQNLRDLIYKYNPFLKIINKNINGSPYPIPKISRSMSYEYSKLLNTEDYNKFKETNLYKIVCDKDENRESK